VRKNPLLYSDHSEVEETISVEQPEEKRSFLFYFIVFANSLLVLLVLVIIWTLFSKPTDTSFDQQLKTWTQQVFNSSDSIEVSPEAPTQVVVTDLDPVTKVSEKEQAQLELEKKIAIKAEQEKLEALALKLQQEKEQANAIQQSIDDAAQAAIIEESRNKPVAIAEPEEPAIVPNAAKVTPEKQSNTAKTQLEQILETMSNQ
jgi:hypothetical protein